MQGPPGLSLPHQHHHHHGSGLGVATAGPGAGAGGIGVGVGVGPGLFFQPQAASLGHPMLQQLQGNDAAIDAMFKSGAF